MSSGLRSTAGATSRVLVVDDHKLLAESLAFALRGKELDVRVAPAAGQETILDAARSYQPDVVLLDLVLGHLNGRALIGPIREVSGAAVLVLTGTCDRVRMAECLEMGAVGVVSKSLDFEDLLTRILRVVGGGSPLTAHERSALLDELRAQRTEKDRRLAPFRQLTPKEQAVLACLMEGKQPKRIAAESFVSVGTVRAQIKAIHVKLGVSSQLAAVALARQAGWSRSEPVQSRS